jgi:hypothetical protein
MAPDAEIQVMGEYAYQIERARIAAEGIPNRGEFGWARYRHCTRKTRYHEEPYSMPGWTHAYRCNFCEGYHITSKPKTGRNKDGAPLALALQDSK